MSLPSLSLMAMIGAGNERHHGGSSPGICSLGNVHGEKLSPSPAHVQGQMTYRSLLQSVSSMCLFKMMAARPIMK